MEFVFKDQVILKINKEVIKDVDDDNEAFYVETIDDIYTIYKKDLLYSIYYKQVTYMQPLPNNYLLGKECI